jgi:hypothetical protein
MYFEVHAARNLELLRSSCPPQVLRVVGCMGGGRGKGGIVSLLVPKRPEYKLPGLKASRKCVSKWDFKSG